jgi:capsular exopolysaccharide synthesis family protein
MSRLTTNQLPQIPLITAMNPNSHISEAYRGLRTNIQFSAADRELKVILISSAQPGEGKSTTVANLAVTFAQENKKVLIIDADLRKPTQHHIFGKSNRKGLTNILIGQFQMVETILETHIENVSLLTSGTISPNPSELLASQRMNHLIEELKDLYDVIIIDSPPALAVTDTQIIAAKCDGVLLVINSGKVKRHLVVKLKANLEHVKARILGVIFNNKEKDVDSTYYYNYYGKEE